MKKKLFLGLMAAAAVSFTACQKDEVLNEVPQDQPIEFGTYVGRGALTKVNTSIDNVGELAEKHFGVFAYYTQTGNYSITESPINFMYNQEVKGTASNATYNWTYSPVKYWPNNPGEKISFFAYAPFDINGGADNITAIELQATNSTGDPKVTYIVQEDCNKHVDLVYSKSNNIDLTKQTIEGTVKFDFAHALSRIGFSAQILNDIVADDKTGENNDNESTNENNAIKTGETTVTIEEIELIGKFTKKSVLNLNGGTWEDVDNLTEDNFTITNTNLYNYKTSSTNTLATKTSLNTNGEAADKGFLMVIPQYFDGSSEDKALQIRVKYTVKTTDENLNGGYSIITNNITSAPFSINFKQGNAYNFHLQLGLTSVKLSATVSTWEDGGDIAVNVPINTTNN